mmetsp:Transcript_45039/g.119027  ORF Transcript_45039/g.119027 Transcript_45039/m.119027 type:complete len:517 (-) Transcript_45039:201-1751(-)
MSVDELQSSGNVRGALLLGSDSQSVASEGIDQIFSSSQGKVEGPLRLLGARRVLWTWRGTEQHWAVLHADFLIAFGEGLGGAVQFCIHVGNIREVDSHGEVLKVTFVAAQGKRQYVRWKAADAASAEKWVTGIRLAVYRFKEGERKQVAQSVLDGEDVDLETKKPRLEAFVSIHDAVNQARAWRRAAAEAARSEASAAAAAVLERDQRQHQEHEARRQREDRARRLGVVVAGAVRRVTVAAVGSGFHALAAHCHAQGLRRVRQESSEMERTHTVCKVLCGVARGGLRRWFETLKVAAAARAQAQICSAAVSKSLQSEVVRHAASIERGRAMVLRRALEEVVHRNLRIAMLELRRLEPSAPISTAVEQSPLVTAPPSPRPDPSRSRAIVRSVALARRRALRLGWQAVRRHTGQAPRVRVPEALCRVLGSLVERRFRQRWSWLVQGCSRQGEQDALSIAERLAALNEDLLDAQRTQAEVARSKGAVTIVLALQRVIHPVTLDAWTSLERNHSATQALA